MDSNPTLDLASIDHGIKNGGPNSAMTPKSKLQREPSFQKKVSSKVPVSETNHAASTSAIAKTQVMTQAEMSPENKDSNGEYDTGSTAGSHGRRSSTRQQDMNWSGLVNIECYGQVYINRYRNYQWIRKLFWIILDHICLLMRRRRSPSIARSTISVISITRSWLVVNRNTKMKGNGYSDI